LYYDEQEMLQSSIYRGDDPFTVYAKIPTVNINKFTTNLTILDRLRFFVTLLIGVRSNAMWPYNIVLFILL
jgi:hypothetical protein